MCQWKASIKWNRVIRNSIKAEIFSRYSNYHGLVDFFILPQICDTLPSQFIEKSTLNIPHNIQLADPEFHKPNQIDALLGVETFYNLMCIGQIPIQGHKAILQKTKLGWIISGKIGEIEKSNKSKCLVSLDQMNSNNYKLWEIEEVDSSRKFLSESEFKAEKFFEETITRDKISGRYTVRLPFNENIRQLGESYKLAERQFFALERKFAKILI